MRIQDQLQRLRTGVALLSGERKVVQAQPIGGKPTEALEGILVGDLRRALLEFTEVPALADQASRLFKLPVVADGVEDQPPRASAVHDVLAAVNSELGGLVYRAKLLIEAFEPLAPAEPERSLAVTLPNDVRDLVALARFATDLQEAVEQSALMVVGEKPELVDVDRGSIVIIFTLSSLVCGFTSVLIAVCARALREKERTDATQKHLESMGLLDPELLGSMKATQHAYRASLAKELDEGYAGQHPPGHNPNEVQQRLLKNMETLMGLLERGAKLQLRAAKHEPGIEDKIIERLPELATKLLGAKAGVDPT